MQSDYDHSDAQSILKFARTLTGKTLRDCLTEEEFELLKENPKDKGNLGLLVEKYFFHINPGNKRGPDFPLARVELKTTALALRKNHKYSAKERLKLTSINYLELDKEQWSDNSLFKKCETILLLISLYEAGVLMIDRRFIADAMLWQLPEKDLAFIRNDWETIVAKVRASKAHELSGSDTLYLEACTSGSGVLKRQPRTTVLAKERSFAFKASYVTASFIMGAKYAQNLEPVLGDGDSPKNFEDIILGKLKPYEGMRVIDLKKGIGLGIGLPKHHLALLSYRMLGIKSKKAEEFIKAGIEIKSINLNHNGTPSQDVSFPAFSYMDIVNEDWEDSVFKQKLDTKMLFIIYQTGKDGVTVFKKGMFWHMPEEDIGEAKRVWEETRRRVRERQAANLPLKGFSFVAHVRNHGANSKPENYIPSPYNGMLKQKGFWLNALYIKAQIDAKT